MAEDSPLPQRFIFEAQPMGLCAGVVRAINAYDTFITANPGETIYSIGEPAHNTHIINRYKELGVRFVNNVNDVPEGGKALMGPHGSTPEDIETARSRGLTFVDTECPLVTRVKDEVSKFTKNGGKVIYYGQEGHAETRAVMGVAPESVTLVEGVDEALAVEVDDPSKVAFNTQTTHNYDEALDMARELQGKFPDLTLPRIDDACYATRNRQKAVKGVIEEGVELMVVVGSPHSSNSRRLAEVAEQGGTQALFVDGVDQLDPKSFEGVERVGLTAGASVEEDQIALVRELLRQTMDARVERVQVADESRISFAPPPVQYPNPK